MRFVTTDKSMIVCTFEKVDDVLLPKMHFQGITFEHGPEEAFPSSQVDMDITVTTVFMGIIQAKLDRLQLLKTRGEGSDPVAAEAVKALQK